MSCPAIDPDHHVTGSSLKDRAREELRDYAVIALYLYVCFFILMLHESVVTGATGAGLLSHGLAAVKALVLGKFILIGKAVDVGSRFKASTLARGIIVRSLLLLVLLVVLTIIEELVVGKVHGKPFTTTLAEIASSPMVRGLSESLVMLLILLPLVATVEINRALGPGVLRRLLFAPRQ